MDEVHERTLDVDFILLLMKQALLAGQTRARLVVMSATLQANVFAEYFAPVLAQDRQRAAAGVAAAAGPVAIPFHRTNPSVGKLPGWKGTSLGEISSTSSLTSFVGRTEWGNPHTHKHKFHHLNLRCEAFSPPLMRLVLRHASIPDRPIGKVSSCVYI